MTTRIPLVCPRCESKSVQCTTMGGLLNAPDSLHDDTNMATCTECKHHGKAGDWQRIFVLKDVFLRRQGSLMQRVTALESGK